MPESTEITTPLVAVVAAVFFALWALQLAWRIRWARGPKPVAGKPLAEFGDLAPAVVHLITAGRSMSHDAAAATVIDLAARGVVGIEEVGPTLSLVRLRRQQEQLRPYEQQVHDHLRSLATDGVVATNALAEGSRDLDKWWVTFTENVTAEARALGLTRKVRGLGSGMSITGVIAFAALGLLVDMLVLPWAGDRPQLALWAPLFFAGFLLMTVFDNKLKGERLTKRGRVAAGQWLTEREQLKGIANISRLPAAAVTIWGRSFAYAAALGLSRAVASLPIVIARHQAEGWSDQGGLWHKVRIRYPGQAGNGGKTSTRIILTVIFLLWVTATVGASIWYATHDFRLQDMDPAIFSLVMVPAGGLAPIAAIILIGWPLGFLVHLRWVSGATRPKADLVVDGKVVRRVNATLNDGPQGKVYIAVDDGRRTIDAYRSTIGRVGTLAEGDEVRVWVSHSGFIAGFEVKARASR